MSCKVERMSYYIVQMRTNVVAVRADLWRVQLAVYRQEMS